MKSVEIRYFASLREKAGKSHELLETDAVTALDLYEQLQSKYGFQLDSSKIKISINSEYRDFSTKIASSDQVVFIPPVSGG